MLENENRFLENEFQRQLDKIVQEKNEQISRLIHIIDQSCSPKSEYKDHMHDEQHLSGKNNFTCEVHERILLKLLSATIKDVL
jgi:hypothetical protein